MFSSCRDDFWGWVQKRNRVRGVPQLCLGCSWVGAPQKAPRGKGQGAWPGAQGGRSCQSSRPSRLGSWKLREPEAQQTFHPFGPRRPSSKGRTVSDRPRGSGQASAGAQGPGGGPEQPRPGDAGAARTAVGGWVRAAPQPGGRGGGRAHGDWCPALRRQPMGGEGVPGAGRKPRLRLCDAPPSRCCAVDDACPRPASEAPPGIRASAEGPRLGPGPGCPRPRPARRPTQAASVSGRGSGGWGTGLGGALGLCRGAGSAFAAVLRGGRRALRGRGQRADAQPRRAGARRNPARSGGRAGEGGRRQREAEDVAPPGGPSPSAPPARGPPALRGLCALAARLRVCEKKVLGR